LVHAFRTKLFIGFKFAMKDMGEARAGQNNPNCTELPKTALN